MIDIRLVRESPERVRAALARRSTQFDTLLDLAVKEDAARRNALTRVEALKADRNARSEEVARRKRAGEETGSLLRDLKALGDRIDEEAPPLKEIERRLDDILLQLPNLPMAEIPDGDAGNNRDVRSWGERREEKGLKPHWEIGEALGILDLPRGAKVAGSGFPLLMGRGARLSRALANFMLDLHTSEHGYREAAPPYMVNEASARGTGQLPDKEATMYVVERDNLYLIPTAEVPVTNIHRDEVLKAADLPLGYVAWTPCFRREAGAHGRDTRGLIRVHQFDKVELVRFCSPDASPGELDLLVKHAETVLQRLGLAYRVVELSAGDLGFAAARTYDLEVWAPGVGAWLEVSSASTFTDFQARRANIRYKPAPDRKPEFVHTLNASGVAFPRTIIALLEAFQEKDGTVRIPEALAPYMGVDRLEPGVG